MLLQTSRKQPSGPVLLQSESVSTMKASRPSSCCSQDLIPSSAPQWPPKRYRIAHNAQAGLSWAKVSQWIWPPNLHCTECLFLGQGRGVWHFNEAVFLEVQLTKLVNYVKPSDSGPRQTQKQQARGFVSFAGWIETLGIQKNTFHFTSTLRLWGGHTHLFSPGLFKRKVMFVWAGHHKDFPRLLGLSLLLDRLCFLDLDGGLKTSLFRKVYQSTEVKLFRSGLLGLRLRVRLHSRAYQTRWLSPSRDLIHLPATRQSTMPCLLRVAFVSSFTSISAPCIEPVVFTRRTHGRWGAWRTLDVVSRRRLPGNRVQFQFEVHAVLFRPRGLGLRRAKARRACGRSFRGSILGHGALFAAGSQVGFQIEVLLVFSGPFPWPCPCPLHWIERSTNKSHNLIVAVSPLLVYT